MNLRPSETTRCNGADCEVCRCHEAAAMRDILDRQLREAVGPSRYRKLKRDEEERRRQLPSQVNGSEEKI